MQSLNYILPEKDQTLLVAVSGGRDSMALLHQLHSSGWKKLIVCHVNHMLRGADSDADEVFVNKQAQALELTYESFDICISTLAAEHKISTELAARDARYSFFQKCALSHGTQHLILAHHADDQAETILHNLFRGSHGLKGMNTRSERNGLILYRPLLSTRRSEINAYISEHNIPYREDLTNSEAIATRNRLRNEALPLLADILQRDPVPPLVALAENESEKISTLDEYLDPQGRLFLPKISALPPFFQAQILHFYLAEHGVISLSKRIIQNCLHLITDPDTAKINLPGKAFLRRKEQRLFLEK